MFAAIKRMLAVFLPALSLDLVDLISIGPLGAPGFFIGSLVGWWYVGTYVSGRKMRLLLSLLAGLYCLLPFTEVLPLASLIVIFRNLMNMRSGNK